MIFNSSHYAQLHTLFSEPDYRGYRPTVKEAPNSDGKIDGAKRFLHVALKYNPPAWAIDYLARAHFEACKVAESLSWLKPEYYPKVENGTLRVLEYPIGSGSVAHTDFDLFTINCYRNGPGLEAYTDTWARDRRATHFGRISGLIGGELPLAHRVVPQDYVQRSIVYFAMPAQDAILPTGERVRDWVARESAKSRYS